MLTTKDVKRAIQRRTAPPRRLPVAAAAAAVGAGIMYLVDPDRGARRRALVRDKSVHSARRLGSLIDKASRDLTYRTRGLVAEARSLGDDHPSDERLRERVRAELGRVVSHPHSIHVEASEGVVSLQGPIPASEVRGLVTRVRRVPGVRGIEDHLTPSACTDARTKGSRDARERWSPIARVGLGAAAAGLIAYGVKQRGSLGLLSAAAGTAILLRDVANRPIRRVLGVGAGRRAVDFHKTILVRAPVEEVYAFFTRVENFPRFMSHVRAIEKLGEDRYHWVADGPLHLPVSWEAEVTERVPNEVFAWRSVPGAAIGNAGVARFERVGEDRTRLDIRMCYNPPLGAVGHAFASVFGADPKHAMDEDLVRFQSLLERGKTTAHHKRVLAEDVGLTK
jgi:uncharacterized membrane protein